MPAKKAVKRERRALTPYDLTEVLREAPAGAWIALSSDRTRILGIGVSASAAAFKAKLKLRKEKKQDQFNLVKMPAEDEGIAAGVR
jgi:hypothetical protein